jgi:hypothetical protein
MLSLFGMVAVCAIVPGPTAAAEPKSTQADSLRPPAQTVNMVCVDAEGQPVAGAEVYLFQFGGAPNRYQQFGPFKSDGQGKAVCTKAIFSNDLGNFDRWIYARIPGRLVGVSRTAKWTNRNVINPEFEVKLQPSGSIKGQVTVPDGFDCTKVTVRVKTLLITTGRGDFEFQMFPRDDHFPGLDSALPEILECHPNAAGEIRFADVPARGKFCLVTAGDGLAEAQWRNERNPIDDPIELTIPRDGPLSGRVLTPEGNPAAGIKIAARLTLVGTSRVYYLSTFRAVSNENGEFTIRGLPQTEFVLSIEDPKNRWTIRPLEHLLVQTGEAQKLTLELERGVLVSGRVLDAEGNPIAGVGFSAVGDGQNGPGLGNDLTDAKGRYRFRIPSGGAHLYFNSLPVGFAYPDPQIVKILDIEPGQADLENLDFTVPRKSD